MNNEQWQTIKRIFDEAFELSQELQYDFVKAQAKNDQLVLEKVIAMLNQHQQATQASTIDNIIDKNVDSLLKSDAPLHIGDVIEQFKVVEKIGEGGMGSVFCANRIGEDFEQMVAIKVMHSQQLSQDNQHRFKQERQILSSLNHKNIASFIGGGQTKEGYPYIILEYVDGMPITEYCMAKMLSVESIIVLFKQVLAAVSYAHRHLVVHRDIKPSNVLVTQSGEVKLLDFGIAKLIEEKLADDESHQITQNMTHHSMRVLSHSSAAPEQVLGEAITTSTDVYGLGALLMQMLSNQTVFDSSSHSAREIETLILEKAPPKPSQKCKESKDPLVQSRGKDIREDLNTIVCHALDKNPLSRYHSVEQFTQDIEQYQQNYPISVRKPSRIYSLAKFVQRNKATSAMATIIVLGLSFFSFIVTQQSFQIELERDRAIENAIIANETTRYLTDIFKSADPNTSDGEVVTATMLIDQALEKVTSLNTSPAIKAELFITLSGVYAAIGEMDNATKTSEKAKQVIQNNDFSNNSLQRISILFEDNLGNLSIYLGDYDKAQAIYEKQILKIETLRQNKVDLGIDLALYLRVANYALATAHSFAGDDELSLEYYLQAIELAKTQAFDEKELASYYMAYGHSLRKTGQFVASKETLLFGIEKLRQVEKKPTLDLAHGLNQLASTLISLNEFEQALSYGKEGLAIREAIHKPDNVEIIASKGIVSNTYAMLDRNDEALTLRYEMLGSIERSFGKEHPFYAQILLATGTLHRLKKEFSIAQTTLNEASLAFTAIYPKGHRLTARPAAELGILYLEMNEQEKAMQILTQLKEIVEQSVPPEHYVSGQSDVLYAIALIRENDTAQARALLQKGIDTFSLTYTPETTQHKRMMSLVERLIPS